MTPRPHLPTGRLRSATAVVAWVLFPAFALAGADLPRRNRNVSTMNAHVAGVEHDLDRTVRASDSLHERTKAWSDAMGSFLRDLDGIANGGFDSAKPFEPQRNALSDARARLAARKWELDAAGSSLRNDIAGRLDAIRGRARADHDALLYARGAQAYEDLARRLDASLVALDARIAALSRRLDEAWTPATDKMVLRMESFLSTSGVADWRAKADAAKAWLAATTDLETLAAPLERDAERVKDLVVAQRAFASRALTERLTSACVEALRRIDGEARFAPLKDRARQRVASTCSDAANRNQVLWGNPALVPNAVLGYATRRAQALQAPCASGDPTYDCATASWLATLPKATVLALPHADLATYEDAWARASGQGGFP